MNLLAVEGQISEVGSLKVADAVWIGAALLQEQSADPNSNFSTEDIVEKVQGLRLTSGTRKSIWQHVNQHCVANRKPQPNRSCMLYATGRGNRRLYRTTDVPHEERRGGATHPAWDVLPAQYRYLESWYAEWDGAHVASGEDPLLAIVGSGRGFFGDVGADAYVSSLRQDWESR
jgi:hypothetical protein